MRYFFCLIFFLFTIFSSCYGTYTVRWYTYRYNSTLTLVKHGINVFLDEVKTSKPYVYQDILYDTIDCASFNKLNIPRILNNLVRSLSKRIKRIESLQGKNIEPLAIVYGTGFVGISIGLAYLFYYVYKNYHSKNNARLKKLKKSLENDAQNKKLIEDLYIIQQDRSAFYLYSFYGACMALVSLYYGLSEINKGLHPHYDDKYLANYEEFLITTQATKKICENIGLDNLKMFCDHYFFAQSFQWNLFPPSCPSLDTFAQNIMSEDMQA